MVWCVRGGLLAVCSPLVSLKMKVSKLHGNVALGAADAIIPVSVYHICHC